MTASEGVPRLPLEGQLDLTYRCNNRCVHCWVRLSKDAPEQVDELGVDEVRGIADEARAMGCRRWGLSGGEPMLRPEFSEVFDYLTRKAVSYWINTNGTLITPSIARLLVRKGTKMVSLYGATAEVHDAVTRTPGSFEQALQGMAYLKEAGAAFVVQLTFVRENVHQRPEMRALALSLSPHIRSGASWLYAPADGSAACARDVHAQRLAPRDVVALDPPGRGGEEAAGWTASSCSALAAGDDRLFAGCIAGRPYFHVDPYGGMAWCSYVTEPGLRHDLRRGSFREAWDDFIPACGEEVRGDEEWRANCGSCELRDDCRWCAVYAHLETGRRSAPVPYLCAVAAEVRRYKEDWEARHRRYFRVAGVTVLLESDLALDTVRFPDELAAFAVDAPGDDIVTLRHHFVMPDRAAWDAGEEVLREPPWAVSRKDGAWVYEGVLPAPEQPPFRLAVFNAGHTRGVVYSPPEDAEFVREHCWFSLSLLPTDLLWLAPVLADRDAAVLHSAAAIVNGRGLLFVGHSGAGKSTTMELLKAERDRSGLDVQVLCDDRNVARRWPEGWRAHGTWSHGTTRGASPSSAPLAAVLFPQQDALNELELLTDRRAVWRRLLTTLIRPMVTAEWWKKELDVLEGLVADVPCYAMRFDTSGAIVAQLVRLAAGEPLAPACASGGTGTPPGGTHVAS